MNYAESDLNNIEFGICLHVVLMTLQNYLNYLSTVYGNENITGRTTTWSELCLMVFEGRTQSGSSHLGNRTLALRRSSQKFAADLEWCLRV
jgi:hypothetical protein